MNPPFDAQAKAKILIVGCGSIGERHLRCFQRTGRAQPFACDSNAALLEKITRQYQVGGYPDLAGALKAEQFDGVVICAPAHLHIGMALASLRAGAAVLIEKPLSVKIEEVDELRRE